MEFDLSDLISGRSLAISSPPYSDLMTAPRPSSVDDALPFNRIGGTPPPSDALKASSSVVDSAISMLIRLGLVAARLRVEEGV